MKSEIDYRESLSENEFQVQYLEQQKPVIIKRMLNSWSAYYNWRVEDFAKFLPHLDITVKNYTSDGKISTKILNMHEYVALINSYEKNKNGLQIPPYCHDIPIFCLEKKLIQDVLPFPVGYLPKWYHHKWWRYIQFFMGPSNSLTPLHFDCLLTNNLFFQISGKKKFTILRYNEKKYCGQKDWRWFKIDPENPDFLRYPSYSKCKPIEFIINPGEILFMPAGTLHHVRSLEPSISFNIDFHTKKTVSKAILSALDGMPYTNIYYNLIVALGLLLKVPARFIFPFYRSYLNYIS